MPERSFDAPGKFAWERIGEVRHVFTHFALKLDVWRAEVPARAKVAGEWLTREDALQTANYLAGVAQRLESLTEFPATPGPACTYCDWRDRCDEAKQVEAVGVDWLDEEWEREAAPF